MALKRYTIKYSVLLEEDDVARAKRIADGLEPEDDEFAERLDEEIENEIRAQSYAVADAANAELEEVLDVADE